MKYKLDLFKYLSKKSNLPIYDEIDTTLEEIKLLRLANICIKLDGYQYGVSRQIRKGGIQVWVLNISRHNAPLAGQDIPLDHPVDKLFYKKYRSLDDFNVPYTVNKKAHKYCESGGWYSMQDIIVIDNIEFVNI